MNQNRTGYKIKKFTYQCILIKFFRSHPLSVRDQMKHNLVALCVVRPINTRNFLHFISVFQKS